MYRRSKFLELLLKMREEMAEEAEYDLDQFVQNLRAPSCKNIEPSNPSRNVVRSNGPAPRKRKR